MRWLVTWILIIFGCSLVAAGFVFFINPYKIVPGGVYGAGVVLHNIFPSIQVGTFGYMFDAFLLSLSFILFGPRFSIRTVIAAMITPGIMNIISSAVYPTKEALQALDPAQILGGVLDLSQHLILASIMGGVVIGVGVGLVVRHQATTGGTDIVAMILQKYCHIKFSNGVLLADSIVVLSGLAVFGFGLGLMDGEPVKEGWLLSLYSLITIYISSRVLAYVLDGASYDKLLFIISEKHNEDLRQFILEKLGRGATYIKSSGMYTNQDKEMIFLVVSRKELVPVQRIVRQCDPKAFLVVTDAYDTYGEGFKPMPTNEDLANL
ncbi:MAG: YitT family protein [Alistipes sp.]|nr:YitT family protein [Candidatus Alistipes equi]